MLRRTHFLKLPRTVGVWLQICTESVIGNNQASSVNNNNNNKINAMERLS